VLAPEIALFCALVDIAVLDERGRFFGGARTQIQSHQWSGSGRLAPGEKLVRTELVGFDRVPGFVEHARPVLFRPDAVEPVVAGNKISSGITNDRHAELADFVQNVFTKSARVRELRPGIVDSLVDGAAQVLQKRSEQVRIERGDSSPGIDINASTGSRRHRLATSSQAACDGREKYSSGTSNACAGSLLQKGTSRTRMSIHRNEWRTPRIYQRCRNNASASMPLKTIVYAAASKRYLR
jgi:hypothetical protein